ncbi:aldehyde dehydrogenase family protein [Microbacterium sp. zg.B48]|uniref:aldehyde dehydrogenase family protein n=1 Tax=Microbacterium sp. zg.B48 TaxID=2969408 RepID=UPI00214AAEF3|nr:aldehyde dehydrogenase family protein [Microbacterium sp. zg.B48]MCR2764297.1 aldehyde dehydrogenase family protein [Microbacterium sp. zg.B48]
MGSTVSDAIRVTHLDQVIDGRDVPGERLIEVRNPGRRDEIVGTVVDGTVDQVDDAVAAAVGASAAWAATAVAERIALLARVGDEIDAHAEELATLVARENGSVRAIIRRELIGAANAFREVGEGLADKLAPQDHPSDAPGQFVRIQKVPYGVVACIVPWNAPLILTANKIAPALAAGNSIVLKPSPFAPLGVTTIGRIAASILPPGVVNVVNGGGEVGSTLTGHRDVRKVSFTGGGETARHIMRQAADSLKGVHFELGGNDPAIVLDDADLQVSVERIVESAFRRAGQVCFAVKRIYVPRTHAEEFRRLLVERVNGITVGDALDERSSMGPVNNEGQLTKIRDLLESTIAQGRDVRVLGSKVNPETWENGYFVLPALVLDAQADDEIVREEQFGPILPVIAYDNEEEAIAMANDTEYGLCSSVWSRSTDRALVVASRIEAGMTIINNHLFSHTGVRQIPFGGWKQSGIGWEGSPHGIDEYLQFHSVDVQSFPETDG